MAFSGYQDLGGAVRKPWVIGIVAVAVLATGIVANASVRTHNAAIETGPPAGVIRSTRYWDVGPGADYDFDTGNISTVQPLRLTFPAGASFDAIVTITLGYRTSPPGDRFVASLLVRRGSKYGPVVHPNPDQWPVAASTVRSSVTLTFRLTTLQGGTEYWFSPSVNVSHRDGNKASISAQSVLMVVDATQLPAIPPPSG
jgi:hypothetical protein